MTSHVHCYIAMHLLSLSGLAAGLYSQGGLFGIDKIDGKYFFNDGGSARKYKKLEFALSPLTITFTSVRSLMSVQ
jgi:hypothetical protein